MKIRQVLILPLLLFIIFLFSGCPTPSTNTDLPVVSASWTTYDSWRRFYTNDIDDLGISYMSSISTTADNFPIEVQMKKITGSADYGYGVLFCKQINGSMYRVMLSTHGYYNIWEKDSSGNYTAISDNGSVTSPSSWVYSSAINTGYEAVNTVIISYADPNYSLKINGTTMESFDRTAESVDLTTGVSGFYVSVGDNTNEKFPNTPVDVRFKMIAPVAFP